jgi:hypothetical protein
VKVLNPQSKRVQTVLRGAALMQLQLDIVAALVTANLLGVFFPDAAASG